MALHKELRIVPFSAQEMFLLVKDVASYCEFLPWVEESKIYNISKNQFDADLIVGASAFKQKYSSRVICNEEKCIITSDLIEGPFKYLRNEWYFKNVTEGDDPKCEISFSLDFEIDNMILKTILSPFLSNAAKLMIEAFEKRAVDIKNKKIT
jgi:coenzyme Q-binding protein COQ10